MDVLRSSWSQIKESLRFPTPLLSLCEQRFLGSLLVVLFVACQGSQAATYTDLSIASGGTVSLRDGDTVIGPITNNGQLHVFANTSYALQNEITGSGKLAKWNSGTLLLGGTTTGVGMTIYSGTISFPPNSSHVVGGISTKADTAMGWLGTLHLAGGMVSSSYTQIEGNMIVSGGTFTGKPGTTYWGDGSMGFGRRNSLYTTPPSLMNSSTLSIDGGVVSATSLIFCGAGNDASVATVTSGSLIAQGSLRLGYNSFTDARLSVAGGYVGSLDAYIGGGFGGVGYGNSVATATVLSGTWCNTRNLLLNDGSLTVGGSGLMIVGGTLSRSGSSALLLNAGGMLQIGNGASSGALGDNAGSFVTNGTLAFSRSDEVVYSGVVSGGGSLKQVGPGVLFLTASNSYVGGTILTGGTLVPSFANAIGSTGTITFDGGVLQYSSNNSADYSGRFSAAAGQKYNIDTNGRTVTFAGPLKSQGGVLTKFGSGTLVLSASNSHSGGTFIKGGELRLTTTSALGKDGLLTVESGTLNLNGVSLSIGALSGSAGGVVTSSSPAVLTCTTALLTTFAGSITAEVSLRKTGTGTLILAGPNVYTGTTAIDGGVVSLAGGSLRGASIYIAASRGSSGAAAISSGSLSTSSVLYVGSGGTGTLDITGGIVSNGYAIIGNKVGSVGRATISSGTWANSGYLSVGESGTGTLNVTGGSVTNSYGGLGYTAGSFGTATISSGTWATSQDLYIGSSGTGVLTMTGGLVTVGGTISTGPYGTINLNAGGTLQVGTGGTSGGISVSSLVNNGTLIFNRSTASGYSGTISGSGAVAKQGVGALTLSGVNTYSGSTTIAAGVFVVPVGGSISHATSSLTVQSGTLSVAGGSVSNGDGTVGVGSSGVIATATVSSGTWVNSGNLAIGSGVYRSILTIAGGIVMVGGTLSKSAYSLINLNAGGTLQIGMGGTTGMLGVSPLTNNGTLVFDRTNHITHSGFISGTGVLWKRGGGTLTLSESFSGTVMVAAGTLEVGNGGVGGAISGDVVNNGTLIFNRSTASGYSGTISGSGAVAKQGVGALTLSGVNTYSGSTTITAGMLVISSTSGLPGYDVAGRWSVAAGASLALRVSGLTNAQANLRISSATATGNLASGAAIGFDTTGTSTYTYASALPVSAGSGIGLAKSGTGILKITGSSTFTGPTVIGGGTLSIGSGGTTGWIGTTSRIVLSSDGVLQFNRSDDYGGISPAISGSGSIVISSGTIAIAAASSGSLTISQSAGEAGTLNVTDGSIFNTGNCVIGYSVGSSGKVTVSGGEWSNNGNLAVGSSGTGVLTMIGGLVTVGGTISTGPYGTIVIGNSGTTGVLLGGGGRLLNNGTLIFNRSDVSAYSGVISGSGAVTKQGIGTVTLSGSSTYTGGTIISGGALVVGNANALGAAGSVTINTGTLNLNGKSLRIGVLNGEGGATITSGAVGAVTLTSTAATNSVYAGVIANGSGTISFTKAGTGTLTFAGPNTLTGSTTIQQGALKLAHASALAVSKITPAVGGTVSLSSYLQTTVGGLNPNAGGLVDVGTGMVTVTNGLSVTALVTALQSGRAGGSWTGSSGITSSAAASAMASSRLRSVGWLDNDNGSVMFGYAATGDTNLDWVIDILDVANFIGSGKFNTGLTTTWAEGDFNYDGYADILDMADFVSTGLFDTGNYNAPAGTIAAVPEPSTLGLVGIGCGVAGFVAMRRKRAA